MPAKFVWDLPVREIPPPYARNVRVLYHPQLDPEVIGGVSMQHAIIHPFSSTDNHVHEYSGEILYCLSGRGQASLCDEIFKFEPDTVFYAPPGVPHQVRNQSDESMKLITVFAPFIPRPAPDKE